MFDWSEIGFTVLEAVLPLLAVTVTGWVLGLAARIWQEYVANKPDLIYKIELAADWVIPVVEQLKKTGAIPDNVTAKQYAVDLVLEYLRAKDVKVDEPRVRILIDNSIEAAVNLYNKYKK